MRIKKICKDKIDIVALTVIAVVFLYFLFFQNMMECGDSFQYEKQYPMREPVYSLLLQLFQIIAGENYFGLVGVFQNILAIICTYWTYRQLRDIYEFSIIASGLTMVGLLSPHILTPLASKTHLILTNCIMTEGITISLYYVWITLLIGYLADYYKKDSVKKILCIDFLIALILSMTRGQMLVCFVIWLLAVFYKTISGKTAVGEKLKICMICIVALLFAVVAKSQLTKVYNLLETGFYVNTVSSKPMMLANVVYVADEEDAEAIDEEDLKEVFQQILSSAKSDGITMDAAPDTIIGRGLFHESVHEELNFEYIDPSIRNVIEQRYDTDASEFVKLMIYEDELCGDIIKKVLPQTLDRFIKNYVYIAILGFVRSVAIEKFHLSIVALIVYILSFLVIIVSLNRKQNINYACIMIMVLITICGNVFGTSLLIECITRYMIYNFPFFYIALMGLLYKSLIK